MPPIDVDGFAFTIDGGHVASKYDDWVFYRKHVVEIRYAKAVDLVVVRHDVSTAFFVEVKDYRLFPRHKSGELADEVAEKMLHTLGGMLAARTRAVIDSEIKVAALVCRSAKLRAVLHLEQPPRPKLMPAKTIQSNLQAKLRQRLMAIDPHAMVVSHADTGDLPWRVTCPPVGSPAG